MPYSATPLLDAATEAAMKLEKDDSVTACWPRLSNRTIGPLTPPRDSGSVALALTPLHTHSWLVSKPSDHCSAPSAVELPLGEKEGKEDSTESLPCDPVPVVPVSHTWSNTMAG